jgi:hypothetical protein
MQVEGRVTFSKGLYSGGEGEEAIMRQNGDEGESVSLQGLLSYN